jgi:hypothetical protein
MNRHAKPDFYQNGRKQLLMFTSSSALNSESKLSKMRILGRCHVTLSNQYWNLALRELIGWSIKRDTSMYLVSAHVGLAS